MRQIRLAVFFLFGLTIAVRAEPAIAPGSGQFVFEGWPVAPLTVWTHAPDPISKGTPVVFVMHGLQRNGQEYRDQWSALAGEHAFLLLVPEFPKDKFPRARSYNMGNVKAADGTLNPPETWTFGALDPIFDFVRTELSLSAEGYALYGHSAGAQFVHRFMLYEPQAKVLHAVAANSGWYTLPTFSEAFPYGLKEAGVSGAMLKTYLGRPMTILLGDQDTDPYLHSLRRTKEAMRQGPNRLVRGYTFFRAGRQAAAREGVHFGWTLATAPGVDHDNARMAPFALPFLLGDVNERSQP